MGPASSASSSSTATPSAPRPSKPDPGAMYTELVALRTQAKASTDPAVQLAFCRTLLTVADALPRSPAALLALADQSGSRNLDPKKIRKQQDVLQHEALKHLKKLATHGNVQGVGKTPYADAQYLLAECYGHGRLGLSHDHERAFALYHAASKQGHAASTYRAAVCYEAGAGVKRDHGRAVSLYRKAAAMGDTAAMFRLGMIQLHGQLNVPVNPRDGIAWLKRAANQADEATPHALHELGMLYEGKTSGILLPDPAYAHDLFLRAAQLAYAPSQYKLGLCHEYGLLNLTVDARRSIAWYAKAAEQGDPDAELALSGWYLTGADGILVQSDQEAYLWARKAADKGLAKAEYAVAYYTEHGVGVRANWDEARRWYLRASSQGHARAMARLKEAAQDGVKPAGKSAKRRKDGDAKDSECSIM
ncbi:hypothetical protein CXG81DRAFT_11173 [Caulochytrium protostelioides]|uniref:HCP-like protein n=1 Tax=Caulochytrium protostelioides TaxID=1555241 RepID=A0A4V1IUX9_9FUNG|nr:hypothetical protein CXG81DRAFT_11173 [Caulochytrium protostelioides]|eukprot:RKP02119.1 hypothetical protein CXG81DRAFT_11173 [Caulochytrium protostelioides]